MDFWELFPAKNELLSLASKATDIQPLNVNAHMHTPYSFSAFESVGQAIELASGQNVKIVGINDFYTTDGYNEWAESCARHKIFPLFNIEFIGLSRSHQEQNIRINDPGNPGRIYLSGKGLSYPFKLKEPFHSKFSALKEKSNHHVRQMCNRLNRHLQHVQAGFTLDYMNILNTRTMGMIRERHLAKVLREKIYENAKTEIEREKILINIFQGKTPQSDPDNFAAVENEIRSVLLKSGGVAFVQEDPDSFLSLESVREMILYADGIPTYPLLADDAHGNFTEFEADKEMLANELKSNGIYSVEFIPMRNSKARLEEYASWFEQQGFIVSFGSEHNTPDLLPVRLLSREGTELDDDLKNINYRGACTIAAHQYLKANGEAGYLQNDGTPLINEQDKYISLGNALIRNFIAK